MTLMRVVRWAVIIVVGGALAAYGKALFEDTPVTWTRTVDGLTWMKQSAADLAAAHPVAFVAAAVGVTAVYGAWRWVMLVDTDAQLGVAFVFHGFLGYLAASSAGDWLAGGPVLTTVAVTVIIPAGVVVVPSLVEAKRRADARAAKARAAALRERPFSHAERFRSLPRVDPSRVPWIPPRTATAADRSLGAVRQRDATDS